MRSSIVFFCKYHDVVVLKTCRWYQTACLVMTRRSIYNVVFLGSCHDLPGSNFEIDLSLNQLSRREKQGGGKIFSLSLYWIKSWGALVTPWNFIARPNDDVMGCIRCWPITFDSTEIEAWDSVPLEQRNPMICNMTYLGHLVTMAWGQNQVDILRSSNNAIRFVSTRQARWY